MKERLFVHLRAGRVFDQNGRALHDLIARRNAEIAGGNLPGA